MDFRKLIVDRQPSAGSAAMRFALRLGSPLYRCAMAIRQTLYAIGVKKSNASPIPVISIGNLSVGGTGKSPAVMWLAKYLRCTGARVAILSRGYGALAGGQNDEALEIESQLPDVPHLQHPDRVSNALLAHEELDMEILVLDDGFQHLRLQRDIDLVLIDATDPPSARRPLPGGLLREPMSALKRAHCICLTRTSQAIPSELSALVDQVTCLAPGVPILRADHAPAALWHQEELRQDLACLAGVQVLAFCGIGNPDSFFDSLPLLGATVLGKKTWPDHHGYSAEDIEEIALWAEEHRSASLLVCTMKDWVKLQVASIGQLPLKALVVEFQVQEDDDLGRFLDLVDGLLPTRS